MRPTDDFLTAGVGNFDWNVAIIAVVFPACTGPIGKWVGNRTTIRKQSRL